MAVVGESGAGKTTLARLIMGLEVPDSGRIVLDGDEIARKSRARERRARARVVQVVFQDPYTSLTPHRNVGALLDEAQKIHFGERSADQRAARTSELLEALGLTGRSARAMPRELSGGQRQRVAIARALAAEPRMLILDEAVSALDVSIQAQILNLLADLRDAMGLTYLMISHDLAVVRQLADHVLVIYRGREMEIGKVEEVLSRPAHPYTQRLIASVPHPNMALERRRVTAEPDSNGGCLFASRCERVHDRCAVEPSLAHDNGNRASRCWLSHPPLDT
jgi:oligopeptide/dipeptide ABC transporter ATP-binding protein